MAPRPKQIPLRLKILIEKPVPGVRHSLQSKDRRPLDPKTSKSGEPLTFDLTVGVAPGPKFYGDQVQREGPERRFVYVRVGQAAGDHASPWSRRMKIDIHELEPDLIEQAIASGGAVQIAVDGTARDGSPACATVRPTRFALSKAEA